MKVWGREVVELVMIFQVEKARRYLLTHGEVYTFRTHKRKKTGRDWITDKRGGKKICDVTITLVREVKAGTIDLVPFAEKSGFSHAWDWTHEIFKLNPKLKAIRGYIYHVEMVKPK